MTRWLEKVSQITGELSRDWRREGSKSFGSLGEERARQRELFKGPEAGTVLEGAKGMRGTFSSPCFFSLSSPSPHLSLSLSLSLSPVPFHLSPLNAHPLFVPLSLSPCLPLCCDWPYPERQYRVVVKSSDFGAI